MLRPQEGITQHGRVRYHGDIFIGRHGWPDFIEKRTVVDLGDVSVVVLGAGSSEDDDE